MKISEITTQDLIDYLRIDDASEIETSEIERMKESAIAQITSYTGLTEEEIDDHADLTQALCVIVADMFDNRNYQVDYKSNSYNEMVKCILNLHSVNLL